MKWQKESEMNVQIDVMNALYVNEIKWGLLVKQCSVGWYGDYLVCGHKDCKE